MSIDFTEIVRVIIPFIGHLSFGLTFLSYAQKDIIRLRMIAVCSLAFGLIYNGWINASMEGDENIWLVIGWLGIFFIQNAYLLFREIRDGLELPLTGKLRDLLVATFPRMHSRDWDLLYKKANTRTFSRGAVILNVGDKTSSLQVIVSGSAEELRDGKKRTCQSGTMWGELTYVMGLDYFNASPVKITCNSDVLVVLEWDYKFLNDICNKNFRLSAALQHGFVHSAGIKHGLLWNDLQT